MKAKCVGTDHGSIAATIGKIYEVVEDDKSNIIPLLIIDDDNERQWMSRKDFELLPDAPKSDWMRVDDAEYIKVDTIIRILFGIDTGIGDKVAHVHTYCDQHDVYAPYLDAFASLVGYLWEDKNG